MQLKNYSFNYPNSKDIKQLYQKSQQYNYLEWIKQYLQFLPLLSLQEKQHYHDQIIKLSNQLLQLPIQYRQKILFKNRNEFLSNKNNQINQLKNDIEEKRNILLELDDSISNIVTLLNNIREQIQQYKSYNNKSISQYKDSNISNMLDSIFGNGNVNNLDTTSQNITFLYVQLDSFHNSFVPLGNVFIKKIQYRNVNINNVPLQAKLTFHFYLDNTWIRLIPIVIRNTYYGAGNNNTRNYWMSIGFADVNITMNQKHNVSYGANLNLQEDFNLLDNIQLRQKYILFNENKITCWYGYSSKPTQRYKTFYNHQQTESGLYSNAILKNTDIPEDRYDHFIQLLKCYKPISIDNTCNGDQTLGINFNNINNRGLKWSQFYFKNHNDTLQSFSIRYEQDNQNKFLYFNRENINPDNQNKIHIRRIDTNIQPNSHIFDLLFRYKKISNSPIAITRQSSTYFQLKPIFVNKYIRIKKK